MTYRHKMWYDGAERISQVHRLLKFNFNDLRVDLRHA